MVTMFPTRRRAEAFARALEGEPTTDAHLGELLETASRLAAVPVVEPRVEFRDSLRARLMEAAAVELPAQAAATAGPGTVGTGPAVVIGDDVRAARRRRRLVAAATGLVLVGGGTGVAAASEQALPGDMLYPIKRTIEAAEVSLARGASDEGRALLDRAGTRLDEAEALGVQGTTSTLDLQAVEGSLADFSSDAASGGERLLAAFTESGNPADVRVLRDFARESHETLADLAHMLPPAAQEALVEADRTVVSLDERAVQVCPDCTGMAPLLQELSAQVSLPDLAPDASPYVEGREPLATPADKDARAPRKQEGAGREDTQARSPRTEAGDGGSVLLPDVVLDGSATAAPRTDQDAAPGTGGGAAPRQGLELGGLLDPRSPSGPGLPPRATEGPDAEDLERVTEPLTEPVEPLLDGAREGIEDGLRKTTDGLQSTTDGLKKSTGDLDGLL
jgi:hypothetical protein